MFKVTKKNITKRPLVTLGLGVVLENTINFAIKNKKPITATAVTVLETANCVLTGDLVLPNVPYSIDSLTQSMDPTSIILKNKPLDYNKSNNDLADFQELEKRLEELVKESNPTFKVENKLLLPISQHNSNIYVDLPQSMYYCYELSMQKITLDDVINTNIITLKNSHDLCEALTCIDCIAYGVIKDHFVQNKNYAINYLQNLIFLVKDCPENYWFNQQENLLKNWVDFERFIKANIFSVLEKTQDNNFENISLKENLRTINLSQIFQQHQNFINQTMIQYQNDIDNTETFSSTNNIDSSIKEEVRKFQENQLRLKESKIILDEISKKHEETNQLVSEKLNSVFGRCEAMSNKIIHEVLPKIDVLTNKCKLTLNNLNFLGYFKSSLVVGGIGIVGFWGLTYILKNPQTFINGLSQIKKLFFGDPTLPVVKVVKKTSETIIKNKVQDNVLVGLSKASITLFIQKLLKFFKK